MVTEGHAVQTSCRVVEVSESGFYDWRSRPPSRRAIRHAWLRPPPCSSTSRSSTTGVAATAPSGCAHPSSTRHCTTNHPLLHESSEPPPRNAGQTTPRRSGRVFPVSGLAEPSAVAEEAGIAACGAPRVGSRPARASRRSRLTVPAHICRSGADANDGRDTDPEQLSRTCGSKNCDVYGYDQSSNGSLISSPSRKAPSSAGSWPG
jgi:hypothetical protein